ncbi:MAG: AsmA family protein, partial [Bacteroidota bacterium]
MIYRWIHTVWRAFTWLTTLLLAFLLLASLVLFGLFQLPQSKQWLAGEVERQLTTQFQGAFRIDRISGIPPFHLTLHDIQITLSDSEEPVLKATSARLELQPWNLIRQRVTFRQIQLAEPEMHLQILDTGDLNLARAFTNRQPVQRPDSMDLPLIQTQWEWIAPQITMEKGVIRTTPPENSDPVHPLHWIPATDLDASFYLEITDEQRFLEIGHFHALFDDNRIGPVQLSGQLFSDARYLELNGFELTSQESRIRWSLEASPVDLASDEWQTQMKDAVWGLQIDEATMPGERLQSLWGRWPFPESLVDVSMQGEGTADRFFVDRLSARVGESSLMAGGVLDSPLDSTANWEASLQNLIFSASEAGQLDRIPTPAGELDPTAFAGSRMEGQLDGSLRHLSLDMAAETLQGQLILDGRVGLGENPAYQVHMRADSIQYAPLLPDQIQRGEINGDLTLQGEDWPNERGDGELSLALRESRWDQIPIEELSSSILWESGRWNHQTTLRTDRSSSRLQGWIEKSDGRWRSQLEGTTSGLDLTRWVTLPIAPVTRLDMELDSALEWENWFDLSGRIGLHVRSAIVNGERLESHQLFADLDPVSEGAERQLRLTSSLLDAELTGMIEPDNMLQTARYWGAYLQERVDDEIRLIETPDESTSQTPPTPLQLELRMDIKNLGPLQAYLPDLPDIQTRGRISLNLESTAEQMLLTGSASDNEIQVQDFRLTRPNASLTVSFRHDTPLREYAAVDLRLLAEESSWRDRRLGRHFTNLTLRNDTARVHQTQMDGDFLRGWDMTMLG